MSAIMDGAVEGAAAIAPVASAEASVIAINATVAGMLLDYADLLQQQGEGGFRVRAYRHAAATVAALPQGVDALLAEGGRDALLAQPAIGWAPAGAIAEIVTTGHWSQLDRLRGGLVPEALFRTIPGIGEELAGRLAADAHLETLEDLEHWVNFGGAELKGIGPRRRRMIALALAERLGQPRGPRSSVTPPPMELLLEVDRMYRQRSSQGALRRIAPKRFNPEGQAWLPIMHARHNDWHFTALHSNTRLAHELGRTRDWVVIYHHRDGQPEGRSTVVTETHGPRAGRRVVRGREDEGAGESSQ